MQNFRTLGLIIKKVRDLFNLSDKYGKIIRCEKYGPLTVVVDNLSCHNTSPVAMLCFISGNGHTFYERYKIAFIFSLQSQGLQFPSFVQFLSE